MGKLIAIEGIDGSGKGTQAGQLEHKLISAGLKTACISFPRYRDTFFGSRIGEYLNGDYGPLESVHPLLAAMLFAADRLESREFLLRTIQENDVTILDRYVGSNMAHQCAKISDHGARKLLLDRIEWIEYYLNYMPAADMTVLLDLPATLAQTLIAKKKARVYTDKAADIHEADVVYLERVRDVYRNLQQRLNWKIVDVSRDGAIRPIDDVSTDVIDQVQKFAVPGIFHVG